MIRDAHIKILASQGKAEDLIEYLSPWEDLTGVDQNDEEAFVRKFGKGL